MAPSKVLLFSFLFSFFLVNSQGLNFAIDTFTPHHQLVRYENEAFVPPDKPFVRLTGVSSDGIPHYFSVGRVLFNTPLTLWSVGRAASFETTIVLEMDPGRKYAPDFFGHGITFFIVPTNSTRHFGEGGGGDNLGIYNAVAPGTPVFAVEFDNAGGDGYNPRYPHIGINISSRRSQNLTRADNMVFRRLTAKITYDFPTKLINVVATYGRTIVRVSFMFNLAGIFPQSVNVGLSGSTGPRRLAFLDVHSWHFNSTVVPMYPDDIKPYVV